MSDKPLYEILKEYTSGSVYPMHMPGHKRNSGLLGAYLPYDIDLTEIYGFDNLQNPEGILKETAELASTLYVSDKTFLSVNGSTGAILSAIYTCVKPEDKVIMARNCHKAVYNAMEITMAKPVYINPEIDELTGVAGSITPGQVEKALEQNPETRLVIITSPTYEGVISNIREIAEAAHKRDIPLLVDSAHGAHLGFSPMLGVNPVSEGADLTVMSLHKTLPALTGCALLHMKGKLVSKVSLSNAMNIFQTSSPSYIMLASIESCLRLVKDKGDELFSKYEKSLMAFIEKAKSLKYLKLFYSGIENKPDCVYSFDPGKLLILTGKAGNINGTELAAILREKYNIETEYALNEAVLAITSISDTEEGFDRLLGALLDIDTKLSPVNEIKHYSSFSIPEQAFLPSWKKGEPGEEIDIIKAAGRISLEYVWAYPPGIPLLVPGEIIPSWLPELLAQSSHRVEDLHSTRGKLPLISCS